MVAAAALARVPRAIAFRPSEPQEALPRADADGKRVVVQWPGSDDVRQSRFHHIWLRDHCRCPECFHPITKQRMLDTFSIPRDIKPHTVEVTTRNLRITWSSGENKHTSEYPWSWLKDNSYDPQPPSEPKSHAPVIWNKDSLHGKIPCVDFEDIMESDLDVFHWLSKIKRLGVCFVRGVPPDMASTEALSHRIAFIRETQYGKMWSFTSDLARGDTAYTNIALPAHTDNTYFTDPAGLQIFHLLEHSGGEGGETLLVDGFYAAQQLKARHPASFELLSQIPIPCHAAGDEETFYRPDPTSGYPVLSLDPHTGDVRHVRWNNNDRSAMNAVHPDLMEQWQAIRDWNACLTDPEAEYWVKLKPGTVVVIDNQRVLHGRAEFTGRRQMCGAYIGKDDFMARLRALSDQAQNHALRRAGKRDVWAAGL
ncbi:Trimethyllysine dioxygenase [Calocera viscosa TUFC12733]|uniref:trimethyllysine dioxygenase n=1 Tax=Calocera viscosa (strain TUFC12733) TaxID=1330018 RepID=A0A167R729_CALVF|nr:Trimethyllysine dioxygenase [Calocera viscosa TUFC12733]